MRYLLVSDVDVVGTRNVALISVKKSDTGL